VEGQHKTPMAKRRKSGQGKNSGRKGTRKKKKELKKSQNGEEEKEEKKKGGLRQTECEFRTKENEKMTKSCVHAGFGRF